MMKVWKKARDKSETAQRDIDKRSKAQKDMNESPAQVFGKMREERVVETVT